MILLQQNKSVFFVLFVLTKKIAARNLTDFVCGVRLVLRHNALFVCGWGVCWGGSDISSCPD
jgi:hypothetical protein